MASEFVSRRLLLEYERNISATLDPRMLYDAIIALEEMRKTWEKLSFSGSDEWVALRHSWMDLRNVIDEIRKQAYAELERNENAPAE